MKRYSMNKASSASFSSLANGLLNQITKCGIIVVAHLLDLFMIHIHRHTKRLKEGIYVILELLGVSEWKILTKVLQA